MIWPETFESERVPTQCNSSVGCRTHAWGIAQANVFANGGQIEVQLPVEISGIALKSQSASAGAGGQRFDVGVITSEHQSTVESVQSTGQRRVRERPVGKLQPALRQGIVNSSADRHIQGSESGGGNVRVETRKQLEIEVAVGGQIEAATTRELQRTMGTEVSSLPEHVQSFNLDELICQDQANRILILQLHIFQVE